MRDKWNRRRRFLKIHVGVDVSSKKIASLKITDERSHDAKHHSMERSSRHWQMLRMIPRTISRIFTMTLYLESRCERTRLADQMDAIKKGVCDIAAWKLPVLVRQRKPWF